MPPKKEKKTPQKKPVKPAKSPVAAAKPAKPAKKVSPPPKQPPVAVSQPQAPKQLPKQPQAEYYYANGKRKTGVARVRLTKGTGTITVNERTFENYFPIPYHQQVVRSPFKLTSLDGKFNVSARVEGSGINAQAEAIRHGISKALLDYDPSLRLTLKRASFLTRDSRVKERKKPGLHRARRAPQFSKR